MGQSDDNTLEAFPLATSPIEMTATSNKQASSPSSARPPYLQQLSSQQLYQQQQQQQSQGPPPDTSTPSTPFETRHSSVSTATSLGRRFSRTFQESELPLGFLNATADMTSSMYAAAQTRSGTRTRRSSTAASDYELRTRTGTGNLSLPSPQTPLREHEPNLAVLEEQRQPSTSFSNEDRKDNNVVTKEEEEESNHSGVLAATTTTAAGGAAAAAAAAAAMTSNGGSGGSADANDASLYKDYDNGYHFPPKYTTKDSMRHGAKAFWNFATTPIGFLVVLYGLNVVAWGGMLFLLLCGAAPAMCHPSCSDINSPRRKWIEVDSQILNALFCVTGFGLVPWRFRDLYYLLKWRLGKEEMALRRLAGLYRGWVRLPGSQNLPIDVGPSNIPSEVPRNVIPFPENKIPDAPLTGRRAPVTNLWRLDFVIWMNVGNTMFQCVLCGFMWGMNRYDRPSWSTGLFVALGCMAGIIGGLASFFEGNRVKAIEGVPLTEEDLQKLSEDRELGIMHINNIKGKKPKEHKQAKDTKGSNGAADNEATGIVDQQ